MNSYPNQNPDPNWGSPQYPPDQSQQTQASLPYGSQWPDRSTSYAGQQLYQQGGGDSYQQQPLYLSDQQQQFYQQDQQQQFYQQGGYQQYPPYQQAAPYARFSRLAMALDRRYLAAGIGAIVSFFSFFLTYYSVSLGNTTAGALSGAQMAGSIGRYWLDLIIALVAIAIPVLLQFGKQWFKTSTTPALQRLVSLLDTKPRDWGLWLCITGLTGIFVHAILDLNHIGEWGIGAWFYLLGMIAVVVGGFLVYRPPASTSTTTTPPPFN